jgi:hypothetical protein
VGFPLHPLRGLTVKRGEVFVGGLLLASVERVDRSEGED